VKRDASARMRKAGLVLLIAWAVVFFCGAVGELFGIEFLRDLTDLKQVFLR
jgi:hypothetical protein